MSSEEHKPLEGPAPKRSRSRVILWNEHQPKQTWCTPGPEFPMGIKIICVNLAPVLYLTWQRWIFHYRGEAGAASLGAVIHVAVLGKMDRRISNIRHFLQRKQRNKHRLCIINCQCVACLINKYIMDNSRTITRVGALETGKSPPSSLCRLSFLTSALLALIWQVWMKCCHAVFTCFTYKTSRLTETSCWLGFLDRTSSGWRIWRRPQSL